MPGYPCGCQPVTGPECGCTGIRPASVQVLIRNIRNISCNCSTMLNGLYTLLPSLVTFASTCSTCYASTNFFCGYSWEGSITIPDTSGTTTYCDTRVWRMEAAIHHDFSLPFLGWKVWFFNTTNANSTDMTFRIGFDCSNYAPASTTFDCMLSYSSSPLDWVGGAAGCNVLGIPPISIDLTPST